MSPVPIAMNRSGTINRAGRKNIRRLTNGVNRRYRSGAVVGDEKSEGLVGKVTRRGSVRVERWVRPTGDGDGNE